VTRWSKPIEVPNLQNLRTHLQRPLTDQEKIPISQDEFNELCVPFSSESRDNALNASQLSALFRVSEDERARDAYLKFVNAITDVPPVRGTEDLFHCTWDNNISGIIRFILSGAEGSRNSNRGTSTGLKRPDYGLLVNNYCVFRGEEKGSDSDGNPLNELSQKIVDWIYKNLPFIIGLLWVLLRFEKVLMHIRQDITHEPRTSAMLQSLPPCL